MGKSTAQKFGENIKMSKPKDVDSYIANSGRTAAEGLNMPSKAKPESPSS
jgi:hypothetical protein